MILLTSTSDLIQIVTGSSGTITAHASWVDLNGTTTTPGRTNPASIATATTTTLVGSPASSTYRNAKLLSVRNEHASTSNLVTIRHTDGTNAHILWQGTLLAGETINFNEGQGWQYLDANGNPKLAATKLDVWLRVTSDVTNATTSFADVTDLTVALKSGKKYGFEAHLYYQTNAATTAGQFGVNIGAAPTALIVGLINMSAPGVTSPTFNGGVATARDTSAAGASTAGPGATNTMAILSGEITPSADGTFAVRCASEVAVAGGLVVKAGSTLRIRELDN